MISVLQMVMTAEQASTPISAGTKSIAEGLFQHFKEQQTKIMEIVVSLSGSDKEKEMIKDSLAFISGQLQQVLSNLPTAPGGGAAATTNK